LVTTRPKGQSYIIKRPRLTRLLDESEARIILLCAPAGYGKTTLAHEWVETRSEPVAWYSGGSEMLDYAALVLGLARTLRELGLTEADQNAINDLAAAEESPEALGRELGLAANRSTSGVLVIDDYHEAVGAPLSERLLEKFVRTTSLTVALTSRVRPYWFTRRLDVYGDAVIVRTNGLAFTAEEVTEVLAARRRPVTEDFLAMASGWPAVIGLAALREDARTRVNGGMLPKELYEYFAEDLYAALPNSIRNLLVVVALSGGNPVVAREHVADDWHALLSLATDRGLVSDGDSQQVEMHPLLKDFVLTKLADDGESLNLTTSVVRALARERDWDACYRCLRRFPVHPLCTEVLSDAWADLLGAGRLVMVERLVELARSSGSSDPILLVTEAEIALRERDDVRAQGLAQHAAEVLKAGPLAARAHLIAARAALLRGDKQGSRTNSRLARTLAEDRDTEATATWLQLIGAIERNHVSSARQLLRSLEDVRDRSPSHALRYHNAKAFLAFEVDAEIDVAAGELELGEGLLPHVSDPLIRTNFLNARAMVLVYQARYDDALDTTRRLLEEARANGLEFVVDHALLARISAQIGLRQLAATRSSLREMEKRATTASTFVSAHADLRKVNLHVATGDLDRAEVLLRSSLPAELPVAAYAEWSAVRSIVLAAIDRRSEARKAIREARSAGTLFTDSTHLPALAEAILDIQAGVKDAEASAAQRLRSAFSAGNKNAIVLACRAFPTLAKASVGDPKLEQPMTELLASSRDVSLGRAAGLAMPREFRRGGGLSPREREIHELIAQGLSNIEIAQTLFISKSTVKVHVRHVFEKLDVRSRAEAAATPLDPEPTA
jgi:LuxR family transcriptional regulator, maltose regulon positive regulatory protein